MIVDENATDSDIVIAYTTLLEDPEAEITGELADALKARALRDRQPTAVKPDHWIRVHTALFNYGISRS